MDIENQSMSAPGESVDQALEPQAPAVETPVSPEPSEVPAPEGAPVAPPAYQPNFKYKVRDKEFEIDEEVRPLIKDKDSEAKWRRMYEKANGLDHVLADKENINKEYTEYKKTYEPILQTAYQANDHLVRGDMEMFFKTIGVPDKQVMQYVLQKLQQEELPQDQRELYNKKTEYERENYQLKSQFEQQQRYIESQLVQQRTQQLEQSLSQPEVASVAQTYDQSKGQPGAFRDLVIFTAQQHLRQTGQDMSAQDAVAQVARMFQIQAAQMPMAQAPAPSPSAPKPVPVIPVAAGGSTSAVKKKIMSVDDLEKEYQSLK